MNPATAAVATRVFSTYRTAALRQVARGAWTRAEAHERLRPWGAIALICDGVVAEVTDRLDELCPRVSHFAGKPRLAPATLETTQRTLLAQDLCPRSEWQPSLARARAEAGARADALREGEDAEAFARSLATWRDLDALARALAIPLRLLCEADAAAASGAAAERKAA